MTAPLRAASPADGAPARSVAELVRAWLAALAAAGTALLSASFGAVGHWFRRARPLLSPISGSPLTISPHVDSEPSHPARNSSPEARDESLGASAAPQLSAWASSAGILG